jgi:hypothetical protein
MELGGCRSRSGPKCLRDPTRGVQVSEPLVANDVAWSIVETQRGLHPLWVFPYRGKQVSTMNNTAWQRARREEGLQACASTIFGTRLHADCAPLVYQSKTEKCCSATPIIRWQAITRAPMLGACSSKRTWSESRGDAHRLARRNADAHELWIKGPAEVRSKNDLADVSA